MPDLLKKVKSFGLTGFYLSLSVENKANLANYSKYLICKSEQLPGCSPNCQDCFMVTNGARFLWATAANALPNQKYEFSEELLTHALTIAYDNEDIAWIHANLAQLYYHKKKSDPAASAKSINHCNKLISLGYMKSWAEGLIEEIGVSHK
jgi:hypothetical protein